MPEHIEYCTYYQTAQHLPSGKFYKVLAQNAASKEQATHLLVLVAPDKVEWMPLGILAPYL